MRDIFRAIATLIIWGAAAGISVTSLVMSEAAAVWIVLISLIAAASATAKVWHEASELPAAAVNVEQAYGKAKRTEADAVNRLGMMLDMFDEDERREIKDRLREKILREASYGGDGELPADAESLESLLATQRRRR
jgi:hypothetical protein